jgi:hypothetical protein
LIERKRYKNNYLLCIVFLRRFSRFWDIFAAKLEHDGAGKSLIITSVVNGNAHESKWLQLLRYRVRKNAATVVTVPHA